MVWCGGRWVSEGKKEGKIAIGAALTFVVCDYALFKI